MNELIYRAVERRLEQQPWWLRWKGTLLIVLSGLAWIATSLAAAPEWQDNGHVAAVGAAATALAAIINRFTRDGVSPSTAPQLAESAPVVGTTAPVVGTTAPAEYVGEHQAQHGPTYSTGTTAPLGV